MNDDANWMPEMVPVPPVDAGLVAIDLTGPVDAGSHQRFTMVYTAGRYGIDDTGSLKVCFRFASDMGKPQLDDPSAANFVSVVASNGATLSSRFDLKGNTRPWDRTLHVKVVAGFMRAGDRITIAFGADPRGPGIQMQTFVDPDFAFRVLVDPIATYTFVEVPGTPKLPIEPGPAHSWSAILPTLRVVGDAVALSIRADDVWGNPTWKHGNRRLTLRVVGPIDCLPETVAMEDGAIPLRLDGLHLPAAGTVHIDVLGESGEAVGRSNPLVVKERASHRAYWGDLHAQSGETIGSGTAEHYLRYARDYAFLDAVGHQGNDFQITPALLGVPQSSDGVSGTSRAGSSPCRATSGPGTRRSAATGTSSTKRKDRPIRRSSHALVAERDDVSTGLLGHKGAVRGTHARTRDDSDVGPLRRPLR